MVGLLISAFIKGATDAEIGMLSFIDRIGCVTQEQQDEQQEYWHYLETLWDENGVIRKTERIIECAPRQEESKDSPAGW